MTDRQRRIQFFRDHAGYVVGRRLLGATRLADAEIHAEKQGWSCSWEPDSDADLSWCSTCERASSDRPFARANRDHSHEVWGCILRTPEDDHAESLWGIADPDRHYCRVIEAELALAALERLRDAERNDREAARYLAL